MYSYSYNCPECNFETGWWWECGENFVIDKLGNYHECSHFRPIRDVARILNTTEGEILNAEWRNTPEACALDDLVALRSGYYSRYFCYDCHAVSDIDDKRQTIKCKKCGSEHVVQMEKLDGAGCPVCKAGMLKKSEPGAMV